MGLGMHLPLLRRVNQIHILDQYLWVYNKVPAIKRWALPLFPWFKGRPCSTLAKYKYQSWIPRDIQACRSSEDGRLAVALSEMPEQWDSSVQHMDCFGWCSEAPNVQAFTSMSHFSTHFQDTTHQVPILHWPSPANKQNNCWPSNQAFCKLDANNFYPI